VKRRRPSPRPLASLEWRLWGGEVVPPKSVVRLKDTTDWLGDRQMRVGYYSRMDGLNCVWLVNDKGEYEQTVDQRMIRRSFEVLERSDETDFYGKDRPVLEALVSQA
jgi:hypothetical protein